jgi:hypothetical protein
MPETLRPSAAVAAWPVSADPAVRAVASGALIAAGIVHALEIKGQLDGVLWLTVGFCALAGVQPLAGLWLLVRPTVAAWVLGGLAGLAPALGYLLTRSVPVPGDTGDVGNWSEPLGVVSLAVEWIVVLLAVIVIPWGRRPVR